MLLVIEKKSSTHTHKLEQQVANTTELKHPLKRDETENLSLIAII